MELDKHFFVVPKVGERSSLWLCSACGLARDHPIHVVPEVPPAPNQEGEQG